MTEAQQRWPVHYLESFDSVRSAWGSAEAGAACVLARSEALVALAFGRDLVVQQSYAFDSLAVQRVLADVAGAYDEVRKANDHFWDAQPRPVRLHLFRARSYADALTANLERIKPLGPQADPDANPPFHSSLYPELHEPDNAADLAGAIEQLRTAGSVHRLATLLGGDERGDLLERTWSWFGTARADNERRVVRAAPIRGAGLNELVLSLIDPENERARALRWSAPEVQRAARAIEELKAAAGPARAPFGDRSRLHGGRIWFGSGMTPDQLLGADDARLVREVVDTLYNRVIVDSIGIASASYTTAVTTPDRAAAEALAQHFALWGVQGSGADAPPDPSAEPAPPLEVRLRDDLDLARPPLDRNQVVDGYRRLLHAREDAEWRARLSEVWKANADGDRDRHARLVAEHVDDLAHRLAGVGTARVQRNGTVRIALITGAAGVAAEGAQAAAEQAVTYFNPWLAVAAAVGGAAVAPLVTWRRRRTAVGASRSALGQLVEAPNAR